MGKKKFLLPQTNPIELGKLINLVKVGALALLSCGASAIISPLALSQSLPIFENITLSPGFRPDPESLRGISGGEVAARTISERIDTSTGPCVGFVDRQPDHILTLTESFDYLSVEVESPEDTTLVISGPGGTWCNDDLQGKNPAIIGQWLAGNYRIWVGSYQRQKFHPYVVRLTETRATR